jgi:hypothetical protein
MENLLLQARRASNNPLDCLETIGTLKRMKFDSASFELLHRNRRLLSRGGMDVFIKYCKDRKRLFRIDATNHRVHQRLRYVLLSCPGGDLPKGKSFQVLAEEAFHVIPPIE